MKEKFRKMFEEHIKVTKSNIKRYKSLVPVCILIKKNMHLEVIGFNFKDSEEKEELRELLKKYILSQSINRYMLFLDSKMTIMQLNEEIQIKDAVICLLCSLILRIQKAIIYDNKSRKILEIKKLFDSEIDKDINISSEWDLYGRSSDSEDEWFSKLNERYQKYKEENPDLYKEVK